MAGASETGHCSVFLNSSGSDIGVLGHVTFLPQEIVIGESVGVNMRKHAGFPLLGLMRYQLTQNWWSVGFLQKSCSGLYANQTVPRSPGVPSFQLQLGRELLLTYSLCWFCESESGPWNACSTFPTCVPLLLPSHKPGSLPWKTPTSEGAQLSGKSIPAQGTTKVDQLPVWRIVCSRAETMNSNAECLCLWRVFCKGVERLHFKRAGFT